MRDRATLMGLMALAMMGEAGMPSSHGDRSRRIEPDSEGDKVRKKEAYKNVLKSKGVQEFNFNGVKVMARTEAKARKKYDAILLNRKD